jgi:circadian clock protein KaiC
MGANIGTGIPELDYILHGGLSPNRLYLVEGTPGSGKTTLGLQYLMEGRSKGEPVLYITLSETRDELLATAASHGWTLEGIKVFELVPIEGDLELENQITIFQPSEMELGVTTQAILAEVERLNPTRVVIDSLSELRLLAQSALRFRRQVLALKQYFRGRSCTVLMLDDKTSEAEDLQLQSIAHGVISLEQLAPEYGAARRRLRITKMRGRKYQGGYHDFTISHGKTTVFPRLVAAAHGQHSREGLLKSGLREVDTLLGGGIDFGTSVLLLGPAGVGKSTLGIQYARQAAQNGENVAIFSFDESLATMRRRMSGLGLPLDDLIESGKMRIQAIDPAELTPGEFADHIRKAVQPPDGSPGVKLILIDSMNGYMNAMSEERFLTIQLHELLTYLGHQGVVTFLVVAQHGVLGSPMQTPLDTSYLADAVILFRYFEFDGEVRQAISVVKKRSGSHERTIREFSMDSSGLHVGKPLRDFHGILTGIPNPLVKNGLSRKRDE